MFAAGESERGADRSSGRQPGRGRRSWLYLLATAAAVLLALAVAVRETWKVFPVTGPDFEPLRHAALALRQGHSIYSDPGFVYPPTAAIAVLPFSFGTYATAHHAWLVLSSGALVGAVVAAVAASRTRSWPLLAAVAVAFFMKSDVLLDNVGVGNVSLPLALLAVVMLIAFEEEHWTIGCALLAVSLLIKPLLIPFALLPLARGRWRSIVLTALPTAVVLVVAIFAVPGGRHFFSRAGYLAEGSNLHGKSVFYNLSLHGLAERFDVGGVATFVRIALAVVVVAMIGAWMQRTAAKGTTSAMGVVLLLAFMLVGPLSEAHYILVACPCLLLALALRPEKRLLALAVPGFFLMTVPRYYFGEVASSPGSLQIRYFLVQVLFLVTAAVVALSSPSRSRETRPSAHESAMREPHPIHPSEPA